MQQHQAALAYSQTAKRTASPRDLEANLLSRSAAEMQRVRDDWENTYDDLEKVLLFNRKLWNVFLASVMREDNPLPAAIRENIANIGVFVLSQLMDTMAHPHPSKLTSLININRELAAGLRGR